MVGDFSNDGNLDLATSNSGDNTATVLLGRGDGTFLPGIDYAVGNIPGPFMAVGDFDGAGNLDLAITSRVDNTVTVLLGRGDGTFLPQTTYAVGSGPNVVVVGDFDGDGTPDLATGNLNWSPSSGTLGPPSVSVLLGRGDGTFLPASEVSRGAHS